MPTALWSLLLLSASAVVVLGAVGDPLVKIPEIECIDDSIHLRVKAYRYDAEVATYNTRAYYYVDKNGVETPMIPSPTVVMKAGHYCDWIIDNQLGEEVDVGCGLKVSNHVHCPNTTNLHTHGLHVSPFQDDVTVTVSPGSTYVYHIDLPRDHIMGTYFYHPHFHGSGFVQLVNGMVGVILVKPNLDYFDLPKDLAMVYGEDGGEGETMLLTQLSLYGLDMTNGVPPCNHIGLLWLDLPGYTNTTLDIDITWNLPVDPAHYRRPDYPWTISEYGGNNANIFQVNGQLHPQAMIKAGEVKVFRFVHGGFIKGLQMRLMSGGKCWMRTLARDGIFTPVPYQNHDDIVLVSGSRADIAIKCSEDAVGMEFMMKAWMNPDFAEALGLNNWAIQENMFSLMVMAADPGAKEMMFPTKGVKFPYYLKSLLKEKPDIEPMVFSFHGTSSPPFIDTVNDRDFAGFGSETQLMNLCLEGVYDLEIAGHDYVTDNVASITPENQCFHPYHHHINPFQVLKLPKEWENLGGAIARVGEFRDMIPSLKSQTLMVRWKPATFEGKYVVHCHTGHHADNGMAAWYEVQPQRLCTACAGYDCQRPAGDGVDGVDGADAADMAHMETMTGGKKTKKSSKTESFGGGVGVGAGVAMLIMGAGVALKSRMAKKKDEPVATAATNGGSAPATVAV